MSKKLCAVVGSGFIAFLLLALPVLAAKEIFHETYEVESGAILEVHNIDGSVTITRSERAVVDVYAEKIIHLGGNSGNVKIEVTTGKTMKIETVHLVKRPHVSVVYKIAVPEGVYVREVTSSDGSLRIDGTQGDLLAKTSDGSVKVTNIAGNVVIKTSDGSVTGQNITGTLEVKTSDGTISVSNVTGDVSTKTSDGSITVKEVQGEVFVESSNGSITVQHVTGFVDVKTNDGSITVKDISGILGLRSSDGSITADVPSIRENVVIRTSDGSIDITLAQDVNASVELKTSDGKIVLHDIELKIHEISTSRVKGTLGEGGHQLEVETSNGNINVYALP